MVIWPSAWRNHKLGLSSLYGGSWKERGGSEPVDTGVVLTAAAALPLLGGIATTFTCCVFKN
jgi:hypothetical protein